MKKILALMRTNLTAQLTALASAPDKAATDLTATLRAQLTQLDELDQLAEPDAGAAYLALLGKQSECAQAVFTDLAATRAALAPATASLPELTGRVAAGELVAKVKVTERCELARTTALESMQPEIAALRQQAVLGLPTLPPQVLALPVAEFNAAVSAAQENLKTATARGLKLEGRGARFLARALFLKADAFATELAELEDAGALGKTKDPLETGPDRELPAAPKPATLGFC